MAKVDHTQQAKQIMEDAKKKSKALLQKAKKEREKELVKLGESCLEFLDEKITKDELNAIAIKSFLREELE